MGGLCIEWEIPDLVRLWNSRFKIQGWEDFSFFIKSQTKMLHFCEGNRARVTETLKAEKFWNKSFFKM